MSKKAGVTVKVDKTANFVRAMDVLTANRVMVGVPQTKDPRRESGQLGNAEIGYLMENGIPENNVPARPHLVPGVASVKAKILNYLRQAGQLAFAGRPDAVARAYHAAGLTGQMAVKSIIRAGIAPPLAESTLRQRAAKGRKGAKKELALRAAGGAATLTNAKPLIDTAQYLNSITYVIRPVRGTSYRKTDIMRGKGKGRKK